MFSLVGTIPAGKNQKTTYKYIHDVNTIENYWKTFSSYRNLLTTSGNNLRDNNNPLPHVFTNLSV